jgi:hypothetical protein
MGEERQVEMPAEWGGIIPSEVFLNEAKKIVEEGEKHGLVLRVLGGVGIRLHSQECVDMVRRLERLGPSEQEFTDIDLMAYRKQRNKMKEFFESLGYSKRKATLSSAASERQIYFHPKDWFFIDVFFDRLIVANHPLDFRTRLELEKPTVNPTDLLLEKLQIVYFSEKDLKDSLALLFAHDLGENDAKEIVNAKHIAALLSADWGFWYTVTTNLNGIKNNVPTMEVLSDDEKKRILSQVQILLDYIEREPKTTGWKLRSVIGAKKRWYAHVETSETVGEFHIWRLKEKPKK